MGSTGVAAPVDPSGDLIIFSSEIPPEGNDSDRPQERRRHLHAVTRPTPTRPVLSAREVEVLLAWLRADSKREAADELFISVSTVSTHIARIRVKYESVGRAATTKSSLFARAIQDGYAVLDEW